MEESWDREIMWDRVAIVWRRDRVGSCGIVAGIVGDVVWNRGRSWADSRIEPTATHHSAHRLEPRPDRPTGFTDSNPTITRQV